ncbi:MAG: hypothetical protein ACR2MG_09105 [Pyrinomonadaceae bacterium]
MNIFEDLIEELKEENLLETTVIGAKKSEVTEDLYAADDIIEVQTALENDGADFENNETAQVIIDDIQTPTNENFPLKFDESAVETSIPAADSKNNFLQPETVMPDKTDDKAEFFRQRATLEVSSLQMVEHVLGGIEREQMKVVPKSYDDLEVKKALHSFLQVSQDSQSSEHAQAEFQLMQETESWYSSLSHRDKHISVAHLRRYCENTRPALSSQALSSLARFYRNSPYSESVRNKFDLVVTRLFSREIGNDERKVVFKREELIASLTGLYDEWASISLYSTDEEDSDVLLAAFKFEDFMTEADTAESFDELIRNDFFNRLRIFKESTNEQFFAPLVTATAIESNIRIGNRYVELLNIERAKGEAEKLENKYGFLHDQVISDATSKTLQLVELLKEKKVTKTETVKQDKTAEPKESLNKAEKRAVEVSPAQPKKESQSRGLFAINKGLLALMVFTVLASFGLYFWSNSYAAPETASPNVKKVNLENSSLKDNIKEARISDDTFFGTVQPAWRNLNREKKVEILKKILSNGSEKGFKNVHLQDETNKTVGSATSDKVAVY